MWLDPSTGNFYGKPGEFEKGFLALDPLMRKAFLQPGQLTREEQRQVELKIMAMLAPRLSDSDIKDLVQKEPDRADPAHSEAMKQVLEGTLALREMGVVKEKRPEMALLNPETGQIITEADVVAEQKKLRARRAKAKKSKNKSKPERGKGP